MQYVLLYTFSNCDPVNTLFYCEISKGLEGFKGENKMLPFVKLVDTFDAAYNYVANDDTVFTFTTNKDAPRYKIVRVDVNNPSSWTEVVEEDERDVLKYAVAVNRNKIIVNYLRDVKSVLQVRDLETGSVLHHLPLDIGTVYDISARRKDSTAFFDYASFLVPGIIYECDLEGEAPEMKILREIVVPGFDRNAFEVNQVKYAILSFG